MGLAGLESARSLCDWLGFGVWGEMWSEVLRAWGGRKDLWGIILRLSQGHVCKILGLLCRE